MKKLCSVGLCVILIASLTACSGKTPNKTGLLQAAVFPEKTGFNDYEARQKNIEENPVSEAFIDSINQFALDTTSALLKDADDNSNYSPLSLYYALALSAEGAGGETRQQLFELLNVDSEKELAEQCLYLYRSIYTDNEISNLKIANSLWLNHDITFKKDFLKTAADSFFASSYSVDFSDSAAAKQMSEWISENTNGTLAPNLNLEPSQLLSILNTVYFYDEWGDSFSKNATEPGIFYTSDDEVMVDYMKKASSSGSFFESELFIRSSLGLKNAGEMTFILPKEGVSVSDLLSSSDSIHQLLTGGTEGYGIIDWTVPKFQFSSKFFLIDMLRSLGVKDAFSDKADFSGITKDFSSISSITQNTHIAIDENGVEASAFTQIDYAGGGMPKDKAEMNLNRPFLYAIQDRNGALLFIGVCHNPAN